MRDIRERNVRKEGNYEPCTFGKSVRLPKKATALEEKAVIKALDRLFSDLVGPMKQQSLGRARYFVALLDASLGFSIVRFIHRKNEAETPWLK